VQIELQNNTPRTGKLLYDRFLYEELLDCKIIPYEEDIYLMMTTSANISIVELIQDSQISMKVISKQKLLNAGAPYQNAGYLISTDPTARFTVLAAFENRLEIYRLHRFDLIHIKDEGISGFIWHIRFVPTQMDETPKFVVVSTSESTLAISYLEINELNEVSSPKFLSLEGTSCSAVIVSDNLPNRLVLVANTGIFLFECRLGYLRLISRFPVIVELNSFARGK
jgi:hypothetical protein